MIFWKSIAIALAVILGLSYAGFAYVYSQARGIGVGAQQPKIVTLLRNQNVTSSWNASVNILGYKTGFLYVNVSALGNLISGINRPFMVSWLFEADEIKGGIPLVFSGDLNSRDVYIHPIDMAGSQMWLFLTPSSNVGPYPLPVVWTVISMSLYLRD